MTLTPIYCAGGNRRYASIAIECGYRYGAQLPSTLYFPIYFADQNYKRPRYVAYLAALKRYRPPLASVLDWSELRRLDEILMRAEEIAQYTQEIMIIPKVDRLDLLPRRIAGKSVRLGFSVPTGFGATNVPTASFRDWPVHLLGGKPADQMRYAREMNVMSVDGNYHQLKAQWAEVWTGVHSKKGVDIWRQLEDMGLGHLTDAPYEAFRRSCQNLYAAWEDFR